jgi:spore coat polysaccharide biosynthesis protein SpsF
MVLGILQARVSSSRLPGKVLKPILGAPMLQRQIERLKSVRRMDRLVVATSDQENDTPLAALCESIGVECFRGNLDDVLDRFYKCAISYAPETVVRITGDCPLIDPQVVDTAIEYFQSHEYDYVSNSLTRTFPDGLDVEVFTLQSIKTAWREAALPSEREHVTPFIYKNPDKFSIGQFTNPIDLSEHRWTVDEQADYELVNIVYETLYPKKRNFSMQDVLELLKARPKLRELNSHFTSNEGYLRSLAEDARFLTAKGESL